MESNVVTTYSQGLLECTGVPHSQENAPPEDPTVGLCLGSWGGARGVDIFLWTRYPCGENKVVPGGNHAVEKHHVYY